MHAPNLSMIQVEEHRHQERIAHAAQKRFIAEARRSENAHTAETAQRRPAIAQCCVRSLVTSLAAIALTMTTKQPGVSASRDA